MKRLRVDIFGKSLNLEGNIVGQKLQTVIFGDLGDLGVVLAVAKMIGSILFPVYDMKWDFGFWEFEIDSAQIVALG